MFVEPAEVLARWAYSDIAGTRAAAYDAAPDIETLRSKRREGVVFHDLARDEREHLEHLCRTVRAPLMKYLDEVQQFVLKPMDRVDLAYLFVPREVEQSDRSMSFAEYACRPQTEQNNARAARRKPTPSTAAVTDQAIRRPLADLVASNSTAVIRQAGPAGCQRFCRAHRSAMPADRRR